MKKYLEIYFKNLEILWNFVSPEKVGTLLLMARSNVFDQGYLSTDPNT